ncbi:HAD-IA family hydrolase [Streptomyces sp. NPDC051020]|uniref:HAD-IA family hydrolase n=1 Tax=Streptomyces sp. NPDC051020 TaxID=3155409 RepID=UPI003418F4D3
MPCADGVGQWREPEPKVSRRDPSAARRARLREARGTGRGDSLYLDPEGILLTEKLERGTLTQTQWNEAAGRLLGTQPDNLMGRIFADLRPETSVIAAAAAARLAGVRIGILSNSVGLLPWNLYDGYELERLYDAVVLSEVHGTRKPEPQMYRHVLDELELRAEDCVFVDDTEQYLPPAAELGFATVHATDPARTVATLETLLGIPLTGKDPDRVTA